MPIFFSINRNWHIGMEVASPVHSTTPGRGGRVAAPAPGNWTQRCLRGEASPPEREGQCACVWCWRLKAPLTVFKIHPFSPSSPSGWRAFSSVSSQKILLLLEVAEVFIAAQRRARPMETLKQSCQRGIISSHQTGLLLSSLNKTSILL